MKTKDFVLFSPVGLTDPIRAEHDGPMPHIVRHYQPKKVYLMFTKETGDWERKYETYSNMIELICSGCEIKSFYTDIEAAHDFDVFSDVLLKQLEQVKSENENCTILLNITSGTAQIMSAICMISLSNPQLYKVVQVRTPDNKGNRTLQFSPDKDDLAEWFDNNMDNLEGAENRCYEPYLLSFKKPMLQYQIQSLIENYNYTGAYELFRQNKGLFTEKAGVMILHGVKRLNLENKAAEKLAKQAGLSDRLYPVQETMLKRLTEYYLSMVIKQKRGELTDKVLRLDVLILNLALYILERFFKIRIEEIAYSKKGHKSEGKSSGPWRLDKEKVEKKIPGISSRLDEDYQHLGGYKWNSELNSKTALIVLSHACNVRRIDEPLEDVIKFMREWNDLKNARNRAAHEMTAITDDDIRKDYGGHNSEKLIRSIETVFIRVGKNSLRRDKHDIFRIYDDLNEMIIEELKQ